MDIIITENQELKGKQMIVFFLLDKQKYNLVETDDDDTIYFVKKIGDEYAEIRFDKDDGGCRFSYDLISFLSTLTGFERSEVQELTSNWVEHTLQMKVKYNFAKFSTTALRLNIPYK